MFKIILKKLTESRGVLYFFILLYFSLVQILQAGFKRLQYTAPWPMEFLQIYIFIIGTFFFMTYLIMKNYKDTGAYVEVSKTSLD